jgi:hypothetical protein
LGHKRFDYDLILRQGFNSSALEQLTSLELQFEIRLLLLFEDLNQRSFLTDNCRFIGVCVIVDQADVWNITRMDPEASNVYLFEQIEQLHFARHKVYSLKGGELEGQQTAILLGKDPRVVHLEEGQVSQQLLLVRILLVHFVLFWS